MRYGTAALKKILTIPLNLIRKADMPGTRSGLFLIAPIWALITTICSISSSRTRMYSGRNF